ncbi:VanZ family protein [Paenibacillus sp. 1P07SE]|uniref:VanZ family protein n=1 Tax=Paenibacillus sp. 1P07SE TaxID=3132209 RepID=UPI0039A64AD2
MVLALYTGLTLYFMFAGFGRQRDFPDFGWRYNFIPQGIPLHFPSGRTFGLWFFNVGNFVAFIPFGILIPLLFRFRLIRFLGLFVLAITLLEMLQMVTGRGSFDIDDIMINTLGAAVGYAAQRVIRQDRTSFHGLVRIGLAAVVFSLLTFTAVAGVNHYLDQPGSRTMALHNVPVTAGEVTWDEQLTAFTVAGERVEPKLNLYSKDNTSSSTFTIALDGQYLTLEGYVAFPDDALSGEGQAGSEMLLVADGTEIYSLGLSPNKYKEENPVLSFEAPVGGVQELRISVMNEHSDPDVKAVMWDIQLREANTGQKIVHRIQRWFRSLL